MKPPKGFDVNKYDSNATKAANKFKRNSKEVKNVVAVTPTMRYSDRYTTRVPVGKNKPMSMTYGSSKGSKGVTKTVNKKKA